MTDTPARLLSLLSLLQTPREWPGSELARRLEVSQRTIRRDIDRLRELGYPVDASRGADGGYRLGAGAAMPPLLLDDEEAVAIAVGLRGAAGQAISGIGESSVRALAKLEQVLPSRLRYRVGALGAATVPLPGTGPAVDPEHLTVFAGAIANTERTRFAYRTGDGTESRRHVEPHRLVSAGRRWYLLGYDLDRDDWRIFRADRIAEPRATGGRATPRQPPAEDVAAYVTDRMYSLLPTYRARVTLHAPMNQVAPAIGDDIGELEPIDDAGCVWNAGADTLDWLAFRLLGLGCEFTVHEPPELLGHLREMAARMHRGISSTVD
ncbi:helix-turn-helix transcriptional regulator [Amycolatopsis regifaucium]|uniref:Transcriptional regulator n=1 Tax=Amycolatopsis regifaucium TaxID=546365 RepID=A0A154MIW6_9PSEU|nr:YafY family protein [Amycolatopsis regifaucium]KZB84275.1 transcriptional regulator [Amycolatopsis regifaucium]OKA03633.1 transcriptional regulator [Amycolatopsis regifaucium]SFJ23760.1 Predicted DNA-binding transcriptional regulator YafY, contains an HTH and WYL domains [Amycolatopsis regifaucium]